MKKQILTAVLILFLGFLQQNEVYACSCSRSHPQENYCTSDFVIVARIRKQFNLNYQKVYKARIRKEFKMSEKAKIALKSGKLLTAVSDSLCGAGLEVGKVYLITGRVQGLQAYISLCNFVKPWNNLTNRQRKGFRLIYSRGCNCLISNMYHLPPRKNVCSWNYTTCQQNYGICLQSPSGQCNWSKSIDLKRCITGEMKKEHEQQLAKSTFSLPSRLSPEFSREKKKHFVSKYNFKSRNEEIKTS